MYITNNPEVAKIVEKHGIDRVFIDLETLGKEERQKNQDSVKSHHTVADVRNISKQLSVSELLVRVNSWNETSKEEIDAVIDAGADIVMLPMWKTVSEVQNFIKSVDKRAKVMLLLETKEAVECVDEVLKLPGIDEIHIGLNDLHLSYGLTFMFELLANGVVENLCQKIKSAGIKYGFGGVARIGEGMLRAESVVAEHYRLGSGMVILSRSFCDTAKITDLDEIDKVFSENIRVLRDCETEVSSFTPEQFEENKKIVTESVNCIVESLKVK